MGMRRALLARTELENVLSAYLEQRTGAFAGGVRFAACGMAAGRWQRRRRSTKRAICESGHSHRAPCAWIIPPGGRREAYRPCERLQLIRSKFVTPNWRRRFKKPIPRLSWPYRQPGECISKGCRSPTSPPIEAVASPPKPRVAASTPTAGTFRRDFAVDALTVAILLLIGFALGYGVREIISRRRHREAARRHQAGPY
jgi:hypothetical protein